MKHKKAKGIIFFLLIMSVILMLASLIWKKAYRDPNVLKQKEKQESDEAFNQLLANSITKKNQYKWKIVINPSHGGNDVGYQVNDINEKNITLSIAQKIKDGNQNSQVGIFLTRDSDTNPSVEQRINMIEQMDADIFIDLNVSKDTQSSTFGTSVFYKTDYYNSELTNVTFADIMEQNIVKAIEGKAIGIFESDDEEFSLLIDQKIPSVSVTCGYISNIKEGEMLTREAYQNNFANGVLSAIDEVIEKLY